MIEYYFSIKHNSWVKECPKCDTVYLGGQSADKAEEILSKYFASDKYRTDGFYGRLGPVEDKEWLKKALVYLEQF